MEVRVEPLSGREARRVLARLARFHYRAGEPASPSRVLAALDTQGDAVGVLCVAFPTLNAPWRETAWPGLFAGAASNRVRAVVLNDHVRTIARVIVDPRWRGMGLAVRLVRAYLLQPETPLTEALASMARFCPFFEAAGMRRVRVAPSRRDERFARVLWEMGVAPLSLVEISSARATLQRSPMLARAVLAWSRASKSTRRHTRGDARRMVELTLLAAQGAWAGGVRGQEVFVTP